MLDHSCSLIPGFDPWFFQIRSFPDLFKQGDSIRHRGFESKFGLASISEDSCSKPRPHYPDSFRPDVDRFCAGGRHYWLYWSSRASLKDRVMNQPANNHSSRWKAVSFGLLLWLIGLVVWDGADRRASDATKPILHSASTDSLWSNPPTLKLASFNIHGGKGADGVRDLARTAELLKDRDFVGLYEVRATADGNQAASLAKLCGVEWLFAPTERQWWSDHFGNSLIYRVPVRSVIRIPLTNTRGKAYRNAILSTVKIDGTDVQILAVHIDREKDRQHQLQSIVDLFLGLQSPCVLMGDLNTTIDDPILVRLRERSDVSSPLHEWLPNGPPSQSIDWIFTRGLKTISAALVVNLASDHPCLKAEFELIKDSMPAVESP